MAPPARRIPLLACAAALRVASASLAEHGAAAAAPSCAAAAAADDAFDDVAALQLAGGAAARGAGARPIASGPPESATCARYPGKRVVLLSANSQYADFLDNWLFHAAPYLSSATEQVVVVAEHKDVIPRLRKMSGAYGVHFDIWHDDTWSQATEDPTATIRFRNRAWVSVVRHRPMLILKLLDEGCTVLYADIDTAWLKPVLPVLEGYGEHDMLVANDDVYHHGKVCTCLMYIRPTIGSKALVKQYLELAKDYENDQVALYHALDTDVGKQTDLVILPDSLFPNRKFFDRYRDTALVVHANWFKEMDKKLDYLKENGFWHEPM